MSLHSDTFRSAAAGSSRDIMDNNIFYGAQSNPLDVNALTEYISNADSEQKQTASQAVVGIVDPKQETLMNKVLPNNNYQINVTNISSQNRSGSKLVNDGTKVSSQVAGAKQEVHQQASRLKGDVENIQKEANVEQKTAAQGVGVDPKAAAATFAPQVSGKGDAVAAMGAGSLGDPGSAVTFVVSLHKSDEKLSFKDQEAVLKQELMQLQSQASSSLSIGGPKTNAPAYDNLNTNDLKELHSLDVNDLSAQLPEALELENTINALNNVDNNHKSLENQGNVNFDAAIDIDSVDVMLAGQGLRDITALTLGADAANDANFSPDVADISDKFSDPDEWTYEPTRLEQLQQMALS